MRKINKKIFTKEEMTFVVLLGIAVGFRQLAMNLITPFVGIYCANLAGGTLGLAGVAFGIFGLTQGFFQVPFGSLGDKYGEKKMILIGVLLMGAGLVMSGFATDASTFIISRALQGSGAITAVAYAWLSSSMPYEKRADAISIVGVIVGIATAISLGGGPILREFMSVRNMLFLSAFFVLLMFILILVFLKNLEEDVEKEKVVFKKGEKLKYLKKLYTDKFFIGLNIVAFLNGVLGLVILFIIPEFSEKLVGSLGMWKVFTPSIIISIIIMRLSTRFIKKGLGREIIIFSTVCLVISLILFKIQGSVIILLIASTIGFTGYNVLFNLIPTGTNLVSNDKFRGLANGMTNLAFFLGGFIGATTTGEMWASHGKLALNGAILISVIMLLISIFIIKSFKKLEIIK